MAMTMTQKILAKHAGLESVRSGQLIEAELDMILGNDITSPVAINEFKKLGIDNELAIVKSLKELISSPSTSFLSFSFFLI